MSVRGFAAALGVSPATISQIENDKAQLTVPRLEQMAAVLQTTAGEILAAETPPAPTAAGPGGPGCAPAGAAGPDWRRYEPLRLDAILAAALAEFLELGYHGTSMRRISARSGVSIAGIYDHYESKQSILMRIIDVTMVDLEWRIAAAAQEGAGVIGRFCCAVENLALFHTYRRELGVIGVSEVRALEEQNRMAVAARRDRQQRIVDAMVIDGTRAGLFATAVPEDAARLVVSMCAGLSNWWRPGGRLSPESVAAEYVEFALRLVDCRERPPSAAT